MTADQWKRVASLYDAACMQAPGERTRFLAEACPDDPLVRDQVQVLLDHDERGGGEPPPSLPHPPTSPGASLIGQQIGEYRFDRRLGSGGMGDVYRARDVKLGRDVAIKVLPDEWQGNHEHRARFEREARVLAALNHPHIGAIYGTLESGSIRGLVLELAAGPTLAQILAARAAGPGGSADAGVPRGLPVGISLAIARQIALALEAAHEKGIVHRDLKPSNIVVQGDLDAAICTGGASDSAGAPIFTVKVLDFGLAKLTTPSATPGESTRLSVGSTRPGVLMGTPGYMSPEQARGQPIDRRGDVWAFGCVLYEMLTGRPAFPGRTMPDTLVAVLDREVDLGALPPDTPAAVRRLIRRCLEKDPARRLRDVGDARLEIEEASATTDEPANAASSAAPIDPGARHAGTAAGAVHHHPVSMTTRALRAPVLWASLATLGGLALMGTIGEWSWPWIGAAPPADPIANRIERFLTSSNEESGSRVSPDGQWVSYLSNARGTIRLLVQRREAGEPREVVIPDGTVLSHVWSPDGQQIAYLLRQGENAILQIVPAFFGGVPLKSIPIHPAPVDARVLRWVDRRVFLRTDPGRSLKSVDLETGVVTNVSSAWKLDATPRSFAVSSDGRRVAFAAALDGQEDLWTSNLDGTSLVRLTNDAHVDRYPLWSAGDAAIIFQSNRGGQIDLWELDLASGVSRALTSSDSIEQAESTSGDGSVVSVLQQTDDMDLWLWNAVSGQGRQITDDALSDFAPALAPSGHLVFQRLRPTPLAMGLADSSLFAGRLEASSPFTPAFVVDGLAPRLSPDGTRLTYLERSGDARMKLLVRDLQTHQSRVLSSSTPLPVYSMSPVDWAEQNVAWNPVRPELYFVDRGENSQIRRYRVGADQADGPMVSADAGQNIHDLHPSPDGRRLAYLRFSSADRSSSLQLVDVDTGVDRPVAQVPGSAYPRGWLDDRNVVIVRAERTNPDFTADLEVLTVSDTGAVRSAFQIARGFISTTRLDRQTRTLYVARAEQGVHNLFALSLTSGRLRPITDNTREDVAFSGFEPQGNGQVLGVREERRSDILLIHRNPESRGSRPTEP